MTRKGKLTTQEKYIIQGMIHLKKTSEEICDEIDRPIHLVQKYVEVELAKIQENIAKAKAQEAEKSSKKDGAVPLKAKDLFLRSDKSGKKTNGITIATEASSERGDSASKRNKKLANRHMDKNIYRISDGKILRNGDKIEED